ncbi:cysteine dioxygenase [Frateuria aurantia]
MISAVDLAFSLEGPAFAASLRLALMDAHRDPNCPRAAQLMGGEHAGTYRRLPLLGPRARDYDLLLIGWPPGHHTAIHDHQGLEGFELMLDGQLIVESYVIDTAPRLSLLPLNRTMLEAGQAEHFGGNTHAHRCINPSATEPALTLHIYSRHLMQCQLFNHDTGGQWSASSCELRSEPPATTLTPRTTAVQR